MNSKVIIVVVILFLIAAVIYIFSRKKSDTSDSPKGPTGPTCSEAGTNCKNMLDCCDNLECVNGKCIDSNLYQPLASFLLSAESQCIIADNEGSLRASGTCSWGLSIDNYWSWDGIKQLSYRVIKKDANGNPVQIITQGIGNPTNTGYPQLVDTGDVRLASNGSIYSKDFSMCLSIEKDTNKLVWINCLNIPYKFQITPPSGCSENGQCFTGSQCCPPFNSCAFGQCAMCFGNPNCNNPTEYSVCDVNTEQFTCISHCKGMVKSCEVDETSLCSIQPDGEYSLECVSRCQKEIPSCSDGHLPMCTGSGDSWDWKCHPDPCSQPAPSISTAPVPDGYSLKGDHFEGPVGKKWIYPEWQCQTQQWVNVPGCNTGYYQKCDGTDIATCNTNTNFDWECIPFTDGVDSCGLIATKPSCADSRCLDLNNCGAVTTPGNNWSWVCPSDSSLNLCQLKSINGWEALRYDGYTGDIIVNKDSKPLYPTITMDSCRSAEAADVSNPDQIPKAKNPKGHVFVENRINKFIGYPPNLDGTHEYVYSDPGSNNDPSLKWYCPTKNPCYPNGSFVTMTGSTWTPQIITPPDGVNYSPTTDELSTVGKCQCYSDHAGNTCEYTSTGTCNGGAISSCDTATTRCINDEYMCTCPVGKYGLNCKFSESDCNSHGIPGMDDEILTCQCRPMYTGPTCETLACQGDVYPPPTSLLPSGKYNWVSLQSFKNSNFDDYDTNLPDSLLTPIIYDSVSQSIKIDEPYADVFLTMNHTRCGVDYDETAGPLTAKFIIGNLPSFASTESIPIPHTKLQESYPIYGIYNVDTGMYLGLGGTVYHEDIAGGTATHIFIPRT